MGKFVSLCLIVISQSSMFAKTVCAGVLLCTGINKYPRCGTLGASLTALSHFTLRAQRELFSVFLSSQFSDFSVSAVTVSPSLFSDITPLESLPHANSNASFNGVHFKDNFYYPPDKSFSNFESNKRRGKLVWKLLLDCWKQVSQSSGAWVSILQPNRMSFLINFVYFCSKGCRIGKPGFKWVLFYQIQ